MEEDNLIEEVDDVSNDAETDDYLNEILTESQEVEEDKSEFDKNKEGVTGDEWKEEEYQKTAEQIKKERNKQNAERRIREKTVFRRRGDRPVRWRDEIGRRPT